jgi:hypothetical protein
MKREKKQIEDKTRNNNFAAAFAYLKSTDKENYRTQGMLAEKIGVDGDTITNILNNRTRVSEDTILKLYNTTGGIFNLQFLRGQSDVMLAADLAPATVPGGFPAGTTPPVPGGFPPGQPSLPDYSSMFNAIIAAKDDAITALKRVLASKEETIAAKDALIATKDTLIATLQRQVNDLRAQVAIEKGMLSSGYPFATGAAEHDQHRQTL